MLASIFPLLLESLSENKASSDEAKSKEGVGENPVTSLKLMAVH